MGSGVRLAPETTQVNQKRWSRIQELFNDALDLPEKEHEDFVRRASAGDDALADEVLALLATHLGRDERQPLPGPLARANEQVRTKDRVVPNGDFKVGQAVGDFELVREIGRGGMGVVFLARQLSLPREVALKILPIHLLTSAETVERFSREGRSAARLHHPNIVSIYEAGESEKAHFIAMEYMPAGDLAQELKLQVEEGPTKGNLQPPKPLGRFAHCAELIAQVAEGVHYAHLANLIHRDIKPQNLLITTEGGLKLADFGLVHDEALDSMTQAGALMGTVPYMSPEQASRSKHKIDKRTDIYSLGAVLYELLTLKPAFAGKSQQDVIDQIAVADPTPMRRINKKIPFDLEVICQTAMARQPSGRYQTALAFAKDLRRFLNHESIIARPPSAASLIKRHLQRRWRRYALLLAIPASSLSTSYVLQERATENRREALLSQTESSLDRSDSLDAALEAPGLAPLEMYQWIETLSQERDQLSPDLRDRLESLIDRYDDKIESLKSAALVGMEAAFRTPKGIEPVDSQGIQDAFAALRLAETLTRPVKREPQGELNPLNAIRPKLSVTATDEAGDPIVARVALRELDPSSGSPMGLRDLGETPLAARPIPIGFYRIVVVPAGGAPREFTRLIDRTVRDLEIECVVRRGEDPHKGMAEVGGGEMMLPGEYGATVSPHVGRTVVVRPFYVARGTVTVGEYLEFLRAEGLPRPAFWALTASSPDDPWPQLLGGEANDLPMTGVSWEEARAYAEWKGLRLLSDIERDFVARGPSGQEYLDSATSSTEFFADWPKVDESNGGSAIDIAQSYLKNALTSLGSDPTKVKPFGVEHLLGNVAEWTESLGTDFDGSTYVPALKGRVVAGCAWMGRNYEETSLCSRYSWGVGPNWALPRLGFRCAASRTP